MRRLGRDVVGDAIHTGDLTDGSERRTRAVARRKREEVTDEGKKRVLSLDELEMLARTAKQRGLKWAALIGLDVYAGLRSGEALGLRWQDVDLEASTIRVRCQRDVPIATSLRRAIAEWKLKSDTRNPSTR